MGNKMNDVRTVQRADLDQVVAEARFEEVLHMAQS